MRANHGTEASSDSGLPAGSWNEHLMDAEGSLNLPSVGTVPRTGLKLILFRNQRRQWHPTPVLLPGKSHGRRSLEGCSPWGRWGLDMTEWLHFHFSLSCTGEGNGNPLQGSCLENPRTGEPGGLPSMGSHRVRHDWSGLAVVVVVAI